MKKSSLIGITGGSGSGKTEIAQALKKQHPATIIIPQDNYYNANHGLSMEEKRAVNYDHPSAFDIELLVKQFKALKEGHPIEMPQYSYEISERLKGTTQVQPGNGIVLEGMFAYYYEELQKILNGKVFVDVPAEERLRRMIERDVKERGRTEEWVRYQYERDMKPMHDHFVEPQKKKAELVIDGMQPLEKSVCEITDYLKSKNIDLGKGG